jgi:HAD superfamily hydrolase (TIGR01509 family)
MELALQEKTMTLLESLKKYTTVVADTGDIEAIARHRPQDIIPRWLGAAATPERIEEIANAKEELYRHLVRRDGILPLPGVAAWVHRLHKERWLQAIAAAAPRANIDAILEALSATHIFQGIVSAEDVQRGKPDPEVYLTAAARVGVPPERCIVVEDAVA